jgi:hypothetical protein
MFSLGLLQVSLFFVSTPVTLEVSSSLTLHEQYLKARERAPSAGLLISRKSFGLVLTELRSCESSCDQQIFLIEANLDRELSRQKADNDRILSSYVTRIDELEASVLETTDRLNQTSKSLGRWRMGFYVLGGIFLGTTTYYTVNQVF